MLTEFVEHSYLLAEYTELKPGTTDQVFGATFDAPKLEFICDHHALLRLTLATSFVVINDAEADPTESVEGVF